jgi:hypothetical protein
VELADVGRTELGVFDGHYVGGDREPPSTAQLLAEVSTDEAGSAEHDRGLCAVSQIVNPKEHATDQSMIIIVMVGGYPCGRGFRR